MKLFLQFLITFGVFLVIDLIWLGFVAKKLYAQYLGYIMGDVNWAAALIFYVLFVIALMYFVILPALDAQSIMVAVTRGAFFGFITYATYDLTNLATLKDWPITITIIDLIWGTVLSTSVSTISYWIITKLF
jgi:uncharacterized membrane protein